jgi:predicted TPR repeat methyltransferase
MIKHLEWRRQIWDQRENRGPVLGHDLMDSLPYPFELSPCVSEVFVNADVLEIGPGNGRQYERLVGVTRSYSICDISPRALEETVFNKIGKKYLITDWDQYLGEQFDVIHFWYVLHHVCLDEMEMFFTFVSNHLRNDGVAAFNCPEAINVQGSNEGDGVGTTYSDPSIVRRTAKGLDMLLELPVGRKSTGFLFLMKKRH